MRRIRKILVRLCLVFLGFLLLVFLIVKYSWHFSSRKERLETFAKEISTAPTVPDSLMVYFYADNEKRKDASLSDELLCYLRGIFSGRHRFTKDGSADDLLRRYFLTPLDGRGRFPAKVILLSIQLGYSLESLVGEEKCANYYVLRDFEETQSGLRYVPYTWVNKQIADLTEEEFIEYVAVRIAPSLYSKFIEPDRFARRVETIGKKATTLKEQE